MDVPTAKPERPEEKSAPGWTLIRGGVELAWASFCSGNYSDTAAVVRELRAFVAHPCEETELPLLRRMSGPSI